MELLLNIRAYSRLGWCCV